MKFENLTPEQQKKARDCKTSEDVLSLAKEEGYELSDDELNAVSGGDWDCWEVCSKYVDDGPCDTLVGGPSPW